ncbi:hypothetical protein ACP70R_033075 [Stipagrostis hirtigluma subsp. patula]
MSSREREGRPPAPGRSSRHWRAPPSLDSATSVALAPVRKESFSRDRTVSSASAWGSTKPAPDMMGSRFYDPILRLDPVSQKTILPRIPILTTLGSISQKHNVRGPKVPAVVHVSSVTVATAPCSSFLPPRYSGDSVSVDETMSTCDSMERPDFEDIDNGNSLMLASLQRRAHEQLHVSEDVEETELKKNAPTPMEIDHLCDVHNNEEERQLSPTLSSGMYMLLREAEIKKRPSADFMETIQKDLNPSMRAILIDWLVEVADEYRLVPDTLYLAVNYVDRYLSGNETKRQRLQLLGVACMLIAAKYEEICAPHVEEFCYITDNTYFRDEVLEMEASVLNYLNFEMAAPTAKCFLRRFVHAAQVCDKDPPLHLELLAGYVTELSLLEYSLLSYPPSVVAASAIFLAKYILQPTKYPWNSTLANYTLYKPSELRNCVNALHRLFSVGPGSSLPAIREKYSQPKYKNVAKKQCPPSIPTEFFRDATC